MNNTAGGMKDWWGRVGWMETGRQRWRTEWTDDRTDEVRRGEEGRMERKARETRWRYRNWGMWGWGEVEHEQRTGWRDRWGICVSLKSDQGLSWRGNCQVWSGVDLLGPDWPGAVCLLTSSLPGRFGLNRCWRISCRSRVLSSLQSYLK